MKRAVTHPVAREVMLGAHLTPSVSQLRVLETFVNQERALVAEIAVLDEALKAKHESLHRLTHESLPEAMQAAGVSKFTTERGLSVEISDFVTGSLPKADIEEGQPRREALDWLRKNKADGIIKTIISLSFGKGQNKEADRLKALLRKNGFKEFIADVGVHPQTLGAFAREALRKGQKLPLKLLGIFLDHKAIVRVPKADKPEASL